MKKQIFRIAALLAAVILTAQSCGGGQQKQPVTLIWWKPFGDYRQADALVQEFRKSNPNVTINFVTKNEETYEDELVNALAAGSGPDIFSIRNDWLPKHKDKMISAPEAVLSLRSYQEDFVQVANDDLVDQGKIYAVPLSVDTLALYYNKDLFAAAGIALPPATWEELVKMTPKLTKMDSQGNFPRSAIALGTSANVNRAQDILAMLMLQNGTTFFDSAKRFTTLGQTIQDDKGNDYSPAARALEFYTQFANPAKISYTWNAHSNNSVEAFTNSQVAMFFSYSYMKDTIKAKAPFLNYAVAPAPQIDGDHKVDFANYWAEGVSKQSKNTGVAWQFLQFISSKDVLPKYYETVKQPSSRRDILKEQINDPDIGVFAENALSAKSLYKPSPSDEETIFLQMIDDVTLRNITPQTAVNLAVQKINLLIQGK